MLVFTRSSPLTSDEIARRQLAGFVVADASETREAVDALIGAGLLTQDTDARLSQTERGRRVFSDIGETVEKMTEALWGDLPVADLEVTHRTLAEVTARARVRGRADGGDPAYALALAFAFASAFQTTIPNHAAPTAMSAPCAIARRAA